MPLVAVAGLAVVGVGVMVVLFLTREDPGARPVEEAVEASGVKAGRSTAGRAGQRGGKRRRG